jgi:hypothetical protein
MVYEKPRIEVIGTASELIQGAPGGSGDGNPMIPFGVGVLGTLIDE